jgi:hypothetical protein
MIIFTPYYNLKNKKMKKGFWSLGNLNKSDYSKKLSEPEDISPLTDEDLESVCNLLKIEKFRTELMDAFRNKTIKLDTSEWFKD